MTTETRADLLREAAARLKAAGVEDPMRDARILMAEAGGFSRAALLLKLEAPPTLEEAARFADWIDQREARRPVAQILGRREFYGRVFRVTSDTLDPRPDSEVLIEAALAALKRRGLEAPRILDLGLGTGCLLLTLLAELPQARGQGVEASPEALEVARFNAAALGLADRAELVLGDWLEGVEGPFDLVISNPPYIGDEDYDVLEPEVVDHEPFGALNGGEDGMEDYELILPDLARVLAPGGFAVFEHGCAQREDLAALAEDCGLVVEEAREDASGLPRALILRPATEKPPFPA